MHKILLVEDDEVIRQQVKKMLEQWGYEVVLVEDFMEVLSIFVKEEPLLVLMDIGLPLFNGYHWCQEIRKVSKVPIMFLSSRDQAMDIVMAINMGGDDFVTKPFDQSVLLAKIQGLLRRSYEFGKDQSLLEYRGVILYLTVIIGVRKFVRFPRYLLCSYPLEIKLWISLWQSIWVGTTL